jgi:hypothetical protein
MMEDLIMTRSSSSALITDEGRQVLLRIQGRFYELSQEELRTVLGLPSGPPGLGITVDGNLLRFEFAADDQAIELSSDQLNRLLAKQVAGKS